MSNVGADESIVVTLTEWSSADSGMNPALRGLSLPAGAPRVLATKLKDRLEILPAFDGLEIRSTSFVGRIDVGPLRIAIEPKLEGLPLTRLMRYAYGIGDLDVVGPTRAATSREGIVDLLVNLLCVEVSGLHARGLIRRYQVKEAMLASPRGRLRVDEIVRRGGVREAGLPCCFHQRSTNWSLNQIVLAGLMHAARLAEDAVLRHRCHRLVQMFMDVEPAPCLSAQQTGEALRHLDRITGGYEPALNLIRLLLEGSGFAFQEASATTSAHVSGFLFDMNVFFQRLLSRFLREHLVSARLVDELQIRDLYRYVPDANPQGLAVPRPRPDYALYHGKALSRFLDAKYRDIWRKKLRPEWLYQLSLYAMASPEPTSVILYPSMDAAASEARLQVCRPVADAGSDACVVTRPVDMNRLSALLAPGLKNLVARQTYAEQLAAL